MWKDSKNTIVIPREFAIAGSTYTVELVENSEKDLGGALGDSTGLFHEIRVAKTCRFEENIVNIPEEATTTNQNIDNEAFEADPDMTYIQNKFLELRFETEKIFKLVNKDYSI